MRNKNKGITLISLVITIIILLILAGISIQAITSDNGLFARAKQAKQETLIQEGKEKIELAITDLMIEKTANGENLTKEDLTKINSIEIDVGSTNNFPVEVIYKNYKYQVGENFKVTYAEEVDGTVVTYTTEPEGYTNVSNAKIKILIKITNPNGIKTIEKPGESDKILANGKQEVGLDYEVTKNGTYTFKIVASNGKETTKDIIIDNIDTVKPKDFNPIISEVKKSSLEIVANAEDGDATEESSKSGIAEYEYYIKKESETEFTKYPENGTTTEKQYKIENLKIGKYKIYVVAYDKAKNSKKSNEIEAEIKYSILEYPVMTSKGMMNYIDEEGNYSYDPDVECTAADALDKAAYDGDETTCYDGVSPKRVFRFGTDFDIYNVCFTIDPNQSGELCKFYKNGAGTIVLWGDVEIVRGEVVHPTYWGRGTRAWWNELTDVKLKLYEIFYDENL